MRTLGAREKIAGMEILVTGAGGFVGRALVPELAGQGHRVRAATRRPDRYRPPPGVVPHRFDLDDAASLAEALEGVELAFYLVHSMAEKGEFARRDLGHARTFGRVARCGLRPPPWSPRPDRYTTRSTPAALAARPKVRACWRSRRANSPFSAIEWTR